MKKRLLPAAAIVVSVFVCGYMAYSKYQEFGEIRALAESIKTDDARLSKDSNNETFEFEAAEILAEEPGNQLVPPPKLGSDSMSDSTSDSNRGNAHKTVVVSKKQSRRAAPPTEEEEAYVGHKRGRLSEEESSISVREVRDGLEDIHSVKESLESFF